MGTDLLTDKLNAARDLLDQAQAEHTSDPLRVLHLLTQTIESATRTAVEIERKAGASWAQIAGDLDVTPQAAHKRFRDRQA